jgi:hypothetical protein
LSIPYETPPQSPTSMPGAALVNRDLEHLKMLSIFWYVWAGLTALGGCFALIYVVLGAAMMAAPPGAMAGATQPGSPSQPSPAAIGGMFMGMGGCIMVFVLGLALLSFFTARGLAKHRNRTFCMIAAGLACLSIPLGTVLGVFTLVVLSRPSVAALFAQNQARLT